MTPASPPTVSVVVPLFDEERGIDGLLERLLPVLDELGESYEIVLVDDGSRDRTWERVGAAAHRHPGVRGIRLLRNFGHQGALLAGLEAARGEALITMDGDLQHPPELIPEMVAAWRGGARTVQTRRLDSEDTGVFKRWSSRAFYAVFARLSGLEPTPGCSDFRLLDRRILAVLLDMQGSDLYLRGAVQWIGGDGTTLTYRAAPRATGTSKYSLGKMVRLSASALVSFSTVPLQLGIWLGLATSALAFLEILYILWRYSGGHTVAGWASVLTVVSFMFGVLFVLLGILGTYLASIHRSLLRRPHYLVRERREGVSLQPSTSTETGPWPIAVGEG